MNENETNSAPKPQQGRKMFVASALALALLGGAATQALVPGYVQPAQAQNLSNQVPAQPTGVYASFADVISTVKPAVVSVRVKTEGTRQLSSMQDDDDNGLPDGSPLERFFKRFQDELGPQGRNTPRPRRPHQYGGAQGSGFFVSDDGYVVTNNHVVSDAAEVEVATDDGQTYKAKIVGTDPRTDLALLKVDADKKFPFVHFAGASPRVGDWVIAVGNPFGLGGTVTAGIVSARGRDIGAGPYDDFLQIDAAVNRGNSGGPTFNLQGEVVGVNTAIFSPSGGNVGIAFAIPSESAQTVVASLKDTGSVTRGWLGVQIQPVTADLAETLGLPKAEGALVAEAQGSSPALKAGIKAGDTITKVNGDAVDGPRELSRKIANMKPNSNVDITIVRDGKEQTVSVKLGELPKEQQVAAANSNSEEDEPKTTSTARLGIEISPAEKGKDGVVVTDVDPDGTAAGKLKEGDVILEVDKAAVSRGSDVTRSIRDAEKAGKKSVLLKVKSGDQTRYLAVEIGRG